MGRPVHPASARGLWAPGLALGAVLCSLSLIAPGCGPGGDGGAGGSIGQAGRGGTTGGPGTGLVVFELLIHSRLDSTASFDWTCRYYCRSIYHIYLRAANVHVPLSRMCLSFSKYFDFPVYRMYCAAACPFVRLSLSVLGTFNIY